MKKLVQKFYVVLCLIFLYAPIAVLIILSFNASKSRVVWGGFTVNWYAQLFTNNQIMQALYNTLLIGFAAALAATVIGVIAAFCINSSRGSSRSLMLGVTNIPLLNADIVTGIALMLLLVRFVTLGFGSILIAHIVFCVPYVVLSVMPKIKTLDNSIYDAARDLGASPLQALFKVVLPDIFPGVLTGFLLAFTMSLDDFVITYFTKGPGIDTLSTLIYGELRKGIKPELYALSTIMFLTVLIILLLINKYSDNEKPVKKQRRYIRNNASVK